MSSAVETEVAQVVVDMARAAIRVWTLVINDGQDKAAVKDAEQRIPRLKVIVDKDKE